jgi:DNA-directed RNA polymerase subunit RPC12/RpoP
VNASIAVQDYYLQEIIGLGNTSFQFTHSCQMDNNILSKCPNCGAGVERANNNTLKCTYCGSKFNLDTKTEDEYRPEPQQGYISEAEFKKRYMDSLKTVEAQVWRNYVKGDHALLGNLY